MMEKLLEEQVAIVTGGNSGIGKAIALLFAAQGARLAILGQAERGTEVIDEIESLTGKKEAIFVPVDISSTKETEEAIGKVADQFGQVDILVNNAGINRDNLLLRMGEGDWDSVMAVNAKSCYNTCRAVIRSMMKARKGKIINMSSIIGIIGNGGQANYSASKAAIIGFTKSLARELASRNICVNAIAPGFIQTPMTDALTEEQKKGILSQIPLGRFGEAQDIGHLALFLASSLSDYITGQVIVIDGGMAI